MNIEILNKSLIGRDFLRLKDKTKLTIDELLDYRESITDRMGLDGYPVEWYQYEINATDEILRIKSK